MLVAGAVLVVGPIFDVVLVVMVVLVCMKSRMRAVENLVILVTKISAYSIEYISIISP